MEVVARFKRFASYTLPEDLTPGPENSNCYGMNNPCVNTLFKEDLTKNSLIDDS